MPHRSFKALRTEEIPEVSSTARLYIHSRTGAQLLSLQNTDENKSFAITFRTPPTNSTGVAHIMEHSVLCGSKNYPLKEPFVELIKGSLHTFLNAFTYPDKTSYPVASTHTQDFYNLTRVYLDAVFFPKITKETFMQEGWHVHQEKETDAPQLKGVVYNEMKGAYNSADRALYDAISQSLFPGSPYSYDSGGDPAHIPDLTYQDFTQFHRECYHPSNALLYFYGDDPEESRLALAAEYLDQFDKKQDVPTADLTHARHAPTRSVVPFAPTQKTEMQKGMIVQSWVLPEPKDHDAALLLKMLNFLLLGTSASPLKKALIDLSIGDDIAGGGLETELARLVFSVGLKGVDTAQEKTVCDCIHNTLTRLATKGFAQTDIDGMLNVTEFHLREQNSGSFPRGLSIVYSILPSWMHGGDPFDALRFQDRLAAIRRRLSAGERVFEQLLNQYFLKNRAMSTVILKPDEKLAKAQEAQERQLLAQKQSLEDVAQTQQLLAAQAVNDKPEDLAKLPKLTLSDMTATIQKVPRQLSKKGGCLVLSTPLDTRGIIYTDSVFDFSHVSPDLLPLVPLYARSLLEMGTAKLSSDAFLQLQTKEVGGIWTTVSTGKLWGSDTHRYTVLLRAKCLPTQLDGLMHISKLVRDEMTFADKQRFLTMLLEERSEYEESFLEEGHQYVQSRLFAQLDEADWVDEQLSGIVQYDVVKSLIKQVQTDWEGVRKRLLKIHAQVLQSRPLVIHVTADQADCQSVTDTLSSVWNKNETTGTDTIVRWPIDLQRQNESIVVPTSVNYVGLGGKLYTAESEFDGSMLVVARYLRLSYLWEQIRMHGGAYGAFVSFDPQTGSLGLISYRDPRLSETVEDYKKIPVWLRSTPISQSLLEQTIIGTISDVDAYQLPDAKGRSDLNRYLLGITDEQRQKTRDEILSTTPADFIAFAEKLEKLLQNASTVVLGPKAFHDSIVFTPLGK